MRAVALALALFFLAVGFAPHVHAGPHGSNDCAVCVVRAADAPKNATPDVEPVRVEAGEPALAPGLPPVSGAPLGAVPGQSPPAAA